MLRPQATVGGFDDAPYWEGCRRGELLVQKCPVTGDFIWPIVPVSPADLKTPLEWVPVSGKGVISHFAVYYRAYDPAFNDHLPYITACIDLPEGVRMTGNVFLDEAELNADGVLGSEGPDNSLIGRAVEVFFEDAGNGLTIPQWKLAS